MNSVKNTRPFCIERSRTRSEILTLVPYHDQTVAWNVDRENVSLHIHKRVAALVVAKHSMTKSQGDQIQLQNSPMVDRSLTMRAKQKWTYKRCMRKGGCIDTDSNTAIFSLSPEMVKNEYRVDVHATDRRTALAHAVLPRQRHKVSLPCVRYNKAVMNYTSLGTTTGSQGPGMPAARFAAGASASPFANRDSKRLSAC